MTTAYNFRLQGSRGGSCVAEVERGRGKWVLVVKVPKQTRRQVTACDVPASTVLLARSKAKWVTGEVAEWKLCFVAHCLHFACCGAHVVLVYMSILTNEINDY